MKKKNFILSIVILLSALNFGFAQTIEVDECLNNAEKYINKSISIEGICTHICKHGGGKIFIMGSDESKTIRIQATKKIGRFDGDCVNNLVSVEGILKEDRIDETYLQRWEQQVKDQTEEKHGDGEEGCSTEKKARGESLSSSTTERIASFRKKIAERKAKEGKEYLSFYHIECTKYNIQK